MSNAQFKEQNANELLLNEEQINSGQYPVEEIYEVSFNGEEFGPIWQQDIKEFLQINNQLSEETTLKNIDSDEWLPIFEHPIFQRRKPQLVSTHSLENEETSFFILRDGQKQGPYTLHEMSTMITSKEILLVDEVSIDDGASWGHLYDIEEFDRRSLKSNEELPSLPSQNTFDSSRPTTRPDEKTNLIAGLAYIGNLKAGKARTQAATKDVIEPSSDQEVFETPEEQSKRFLWPALFCISLIGLIFLYTTWDSDKVKSVKNKKTNKSRSIASKPRVLKPIKLEPIRNKRKSKIEKNARINSRPTSFKRSKAFRQAAKKKKLSNNALIKEENDDYYYDDNSDPVELDPIRSTLSKDTIDPEFEIEGEFPDRSPASDEVFDEETEY
jgi:hypothetical protein